MNLLNSLLLDSFIHIRIFKTPWHAKDRFPGFRKRVGSLRAVGETQTLKIENFSCLIAVMWLKYCQNGVKP
jgi:hypothetical protein